MSYLFDGINHPSAATVLAAGAAGALMYGGTPGDGLGKDFTAGQYADYKAHGLLTAFVYENSANDMGTGAAGGAAHAAALLADLHAKGVSRTEPVGATVDEHVTAANLPLAVAYQRGFYQTVKASGWAGLDGGYGFAEFLIAIHDAGLADWYWGAGTRSLLPPYTNIWQDNTGVINVGGSADDKDWILIPLTGGQMELTDPLPDPLSVQGKGTVAEGLTANIYGIGGVRNGGALANAVGGIAAVQAKQTAALTALAAALATTDADVKAAMTQEAADHAADLTAVAKVNSIDPVALEPVLQAALTALGWTPPPSVKDIAVADAAAVAPAVLALIQARLAGGTS